MNKNKINNSNNKNKTNKETSKEFQTNKIKNRKINLKKSSSSFL